MGLQETVSNYISENNTVPSYNISTIVNAVFPSGYSLYYLPSPLNMPQGSMFGIESTLAVNRLSTSPYSDYELNTNSFINAANPTQTLSFYFRATGYTVLCTSSYDFLKSYTLGGTFTINASFACNSEFYSSQTEVVVIETSKPTHKTCFLNSLSFIF